MGRIIEASITRAFHRQQVVGAGSLIGRLHIITCAHVIASTTTPVVLTPNVTTGDVRTDFPLVAAGQ
jgi:hypothetical protein